MVGFSIQCNRHILTNIAIQLLGCMWSQILFIYTLRCSILSMFAMTFHRYMIVIHSYHLSQKKVYAIIGSIWLGMALSIGLFAASQSQDTAIGLQASKLYCYLAMDSTETHNIISSSFVIFVLLVTMLFLVFAYYSIVKRYIDMKAMAAKKKNGESGKSPIQKIAEPPADGRANEITIINRLGENEIKVIKKAIAISGSFSAVWTFFVGKSIFEMVCHQEVSSYYDIFTVLLYAANPIVNGIILYLYDAKCRKNINELFYYKTLVSILESKRRKRTLVKPQKADIGQIKLVNLNIANAGEVSTLQQGSFTVSTVKMYS